MAILRWPRNVLRKKSLLVTLSKTASSQGWNVIFDKALAEINQVLKNNNIELTYGKPENPINAYIVIDTEPGHGLHGKAQITPAKDGDKIWIDSVKTCCRPRRAYTRAIRNPAWRGAGPGSTCWSTN